MTVTKPNDKRESHHCKKHNLIYSKSCIKCVKEKKKIKCPKCKMMMDCDGKGNHECPQGCHEQ